MDEQQAPTNDPVRHVVQTSGGVSQLVGIAAGVICLIAGVYLFFTESASEEATIFDALFKALGAYIFARGLWMLTKLR